MNAWMKAELAERRNGGLYRVRRGVQSAQGVHLRLGGREVLSFASNDYLNLAADRRLARAASRAARRYGCGAGASPLVSGYLPPHRSLEKALTQWENTEATLLFSSGYATNLAVVSALVSREDAIFSDELNHASLIDGCRLSRAAVHIYRHADANHLDDLLRREGRQARRRLIVTDTVFSMDGDWAPLADLYDLALRHDCLLLIDEAHATGVLGERGTGLSELAGPDFRSLKDFGSRSDGSLNDRLIKIGTLSKALGSQGGFVCGSRTLVDWLVNHARPYIFSTALAPPSAAAARRAVAIVEKEPERCRHLLALSDSLRTGLIAMGLPPSRSRGQIVPVIVGDSQAAVELSARLEERGLLAPAIRPPSIPEGTARLRISLTAGHSQEDIDRLLAALRANIGKPVSL
jgi:8-amino-7-oxononanoate synthase